MQHFSQKKRNNKEIGGLGEGISVNYLKDKGFQILETNYLKKWGEIDIVARGTDKIHFVEVKTVSYETKKHLDMALADKTWRPEENVHKYKINKIAKATESWLVENKCGLDWQIDVIAVRVVPREKYATIKYLPNIIL